MKILFVIGSYRKNSFNKQLADKAKEMIGDQAEVTYLDYSKVPMINEDTEFPTDPEVQKLWDTVKDHDGMWIFSPEYNSSYPGHLKNMLDWLSRPYEPGNYKLGTAAKGVKATVSNVGGGRAGQKSREKLIELMDKIGMEVMKEPNLGVGLNREAYETDILGSDQDYETELQAQVQAFLDFIK